MFFALGGRKRAYFIVHTLLRLKFELTVVEYFILLSKIPDYRKFM